MSKRAFIGCRYSEPWLPWGYQLKAGHLFLSFLAARRISLCETQILRAARNDKKRMTLLSRLKRVFPFGKPPPELYIIIEFKVILQLLEIRLTHGDKSQL